MKYYIILFLSFIVNVMAADTCNTTEDCKGILEVCFNGEADRYNRDTYMTCRVSGGYIVLIVVGVILLIAALLRIRCRC